ncbi:MAG: hypothetical protein MNPFHGCM_00724 [Gemmatimonadaceae bacterium]|nr:hypothetical protein [Gemmatimonadaceae bacterium]
MGTAGSSSTTASGTNEWHSWARSLLASHVALVLFSTIALTTILNGPPSPLLLREPNATIMRLGWTLSGPTYVVLGALAALAHATGAVGARRAVALFSIASGIALASELLGTSTGLPFGEYRYTPLLGYRILGLVPFPIPVSWFYMLYSSLAIVSRLRPARDDAATRWKWAALAGLVLLAWDVSMDPAMVATAHWVWGAGDAFHDAAIPVWLTAFFAHDVFYGMPLSNWFGWYVTGTLIAWLMLMITPPTCIAQRIAPSRLPLFLYLANGIMPVALCIRDDLRLAALLGGVAMLLPFVLAWRARVPAMPRAVTRGAA